MNAIISFVNLISEINNFMFCVRYLILCTALDTYRKNKTCDKARLF